MPLLRGIFFDLMKLITSLLLASCLCCTSIILAQEQASGGASNASSGAVGYSGGGSSGVGIIVGDNYVLKPSDVIQVEVYQEVDLDKSVRIEGDGTVALALIGKVKLAGMAVAEAQSLITDLYNRDYLVDPQISLLVVSFAPRVIRVLGSVNSPGVVEIPPDRDLTLTEAIAGVNGISRLGNPKSLKIKRVNGDQGALQMQVNFSKIVTDPDVDDVVLQEGDTIWVPERII
ncbi:MAG TPA: sugar transporter [Opitutae bacterium]|nr:sugar transporter [Opitutae bacterium]